MNSLQEFIIGVSTFINNVLLPFLFALALLFFIYNAFRFFIFESDDTDGREKAKRMALYGILAFVFLVSIWGIVNMLVNGLGIGGNRALNSDYIEVNSNSSGGSWFDFGFDIGFNLANEPSYQNSPTPGGELGPGPTGNSSGWGWGQ